MSRKPSPPARKLIKTNSSPLVGEARWGGGKHLILFIILLLGLILRLSYLSEFRQTPFFNAQLLSGLDQRTWDEVGAKIASHPWFVDGQPFYQPPGYAYFLAAVYRIFGLHNYLAAGIIQILLDLWAAFLIFLVGKRLWNDWVGIIACILYALYRPFIYYSATLLSDSFILFTNVLCLFLVYWTLESPERKNRWLLAGLGFGLAVIAKPTILLFAFFSLLLVIVNRCLLFPHAKYVIPADSKRESIPYKILSPTGRGEVRGKNLILPFLLFLLGLSLLVAPVIVRNSLLAGKFVTVSTNGPVAWQFGNSADSIGLFVYPHGPLLSPASLDFWKLWGKKTLFFFSSYEWPQNLNIYLLASITNTLKLPLVAFGLVVPLGLVGFFTASNIKFRYLQIYTFASVISVVAFFITGRYRLPATAGFILLASGYLYFLFEKIWSLRMYFFPLPTGERTKVRGDSVVRPIPGHQLFSSHPNKDLISVLSSLCALAIISFVLVNSWSGPRIGELHAKYYVIATERSVAYDREHGQAALAQKKIDTFSRFILQYQSGQIY
ncbi:MAG: glycosyltransferase family 39 protein [Candidatus Omnitrophica bacterium]|nr:glycosyltransferase family 39 protein [Candidatus Omnitrophota bacterium]